MSLSHAKPPVPANRASSLTALLAHALGVSATDLAPKLDVAPTRWQAFLDALDMPALPDGLADCLMRVHGVLRAVGAGQRYEAVMAGLRFPIEAAGVRWRRQLGRGDGEREAFSNALGKLRLEHVGLHVGRHVSVDGHAVDWAIAGLLYDGTPLRLALLVRPEPTTFTALAEDLADDALAAQGFELLEFRDWQLRFAGACALHVAEAIAARAPGLRVPPRLFDPDDRHAIFRVQSAPLRLTPRETSPNWQLREWLRQSQPGLDEAALLARYEAAMIERSRASAEGEEWVHWG
ncbi:MAG TPA: hypothetical protein V6D47_03600 [Oscillatoriaceae cyanobacterium]